MGGARTRHHLTVQSTPCVFRNILLVRPILSERLFVDFVRVAGFLPFPSGTLPPQFSLKKDT